MKQKQLEISLEYRTKKKFNKPPVGERGTRGIKRHRVTNDARQCKGVVRLSGTREIRNRVVHVGDSDSLAGFV